MIGGPREVPARSELRVALQRVAGAALFAAAFVTALFLGALFFALLVGLGAAALVALKLRQWWLGRRRVRDPYYRVQRDSRGHSVIETEYHVVRRREDR